MFAGKGLIRETKPLSKSTWAARSMDISCSVYLGQFTGRQTAKVPALAQMLALVISGF